MKPPALYLLETLLCSGSFLAVYRMWLVGRLPYRWCRVYLILTSLLAVAIPTVRIPVYPAPPVRSEVSVQPHSGVAEPAVFPKLHEAAPDVPALASAGWSTRLGAVAAGAYLLVAALLALSLVRRIAWVVRLRRRSTLTTMEEYTLAEHPDVCTPFAFLRTVFLGCGFEGAEREQILCHEASHVRHGHTAERLLFEVLRCVVWFNPFVWIAERSLQEVQEWEADRDVLDAGWDLTHYRIVIFRQLFGYRPDITCGLNHSFTKKRFLMMTQFSEGKHALRRLGVAIPIVAGMILLCSFTTRPARTPSAERSVSSPSGAAVSDSLERRLVQIAAPASSAHPATYLLDGRPASLDAIAEEFAALPDRLKRNTLVEIAPGPGVRMVSVEDLKRVLHKASECRIFYREPDGGGGEKAEAFRDEGGLKRFDHGDVAIKERNLFLVYVNGSGQIMSGGWGHLQSTQLSELKGAVLRFLANEENDPNLSEKETVEIVLPDGGNWSYPQSLGIVSLQVAQGLDYPTYLSVGQQLGAAFAELREQAAHRRFGKGFDDLTDAEREAVADAVPLRIVEAEPHP